MTATRADWAWLVLWGIVSSMWCFAAEQTLGPTYDEPFYFRAGMECWRVKNHKALMDAGTMPLPVEAQTLLVCVLARLARVDPMDFTFWLPTLRLVTLAFWWTLLAAVLICARRWGGSWAGRLAVAVLACEPVLLGHASLATTDIAFTAAMLTLIAVFLTTRDQPTFRWSVLPSALAVAFALLAKASTLAYAPVCLILLECLRLHRNGLPDWRTPEFRTRILRSATELATMLLLGAVMVCVVCPRAYRAVLFQINHQREGHGLVYLFGEVSWSGFWYYFPLTLLCKSSLAFLALGLLAVFLGGRRLFNAPLLLAVALTVLSLTFRVQLGVRFVLPILVLFVIGFSVALTRELSPSWRSFRQTALTLLLVGGLVDAWSVWPNGICYTNALWGGTRNGYLVAGDSNYDWGQGVSELTAWQREHAEQPMSVWYFGTDPKIERTTIRQDDYWYQPPEKMCQMSRGRFVAVSTTLLYGYAHDRPASVFLRGLRPCGRTTTFLIYDFSEETIAWME
jgi:hypothetical protein